MPIIPPDIGFLVSILITGLSNLFRSRALPRWLNVLIVIIAMSLISVAIAWLTTGFTADIRRNVLLVAGIIVSLFTGIRELGDLLKYLQEAPSPLAKEQRRVRVGTADWTAKNE